ncbi:MAG: anti-anti-sigma factor [Candidatus Riflebacteria bacterium HGW-Riflebacteria-2]|jgi:anti-anti-sigma factor|nr:MAG: anti-anti-sigma factor [Candidatus Riflebacteria bacterium HGW-Riflebacteria-2]
MDLQYKMDLNDGIASITLSGSLDATNAGTFQEELKKLIGQDVKKIVFMAKDLTYIASAGLRVMIFAKQRIGADVQVYLVGAQEAVLDVVKMSGLDTFMTIQKEFEG